MISKTLLRSLLTALGIYFCDLPIQCQEITFEKRLLFDSSESLVSVLRIRKDQFMVLSSEPSHLSPYFFLSWYNKQFDTIQRIKYEWEGFQANKMALLPNEDIAIVGTVHTNDPINGADYGVIYIAKNGLVKWKKTYGGSLIDSGERICYFNGKILIGGSSTSNKSGHKSENSRGRFDYWFLTLDLDGNKISDKTIGGNHDDRLNLLLPQNAEKLKLNGHSMSAISGEKRVAPKGMGDVWSFTMDTAWNIINQIALGNEFENNPSQGILEDKYSSMILTNDKYSSDSKNLKITLSKIDTNGQTIKSKIFKTDLSDAASNLIGTCDGGYIITATSKSGKFGDKSESAYGGPDIWIIRLDKDWNILWDKTIGGLTTESGPILLRKNKREYVLMFNSQSPRSGNLSQENPDYKLSPYVIKISDHSTPKNWYKAWRKGCSICESIDELIEIENLLNQATEMRELNPEDWE